MSEKCQILKNNTTSTHMTVHFRGAIEEWDDYDHLFKDLKNLTESDIVTLVLNTSGGDCSIGFSIIDRLLNLPCKLDVIVEYPTYSMGAIMALCGDSLKIEPDSYIMFHDYSGGMKGKGGETFLYTDNYRKVFKARFKKLCTPFLTDDEVERMFKGEDIYISDTDPTLKARIKRHFKTI